MNTDRQWFECKATYEHVAEDGMTKNTTDTYLIEAVSFADAEKRFIEEITPYMDCEFDVKAVNKRNYAEILWNDDAAADKWFKSKIALISIDEVSGMEKKKAYNILAQANGIDNALQRIHDAMKTSMSDYVIQSVSETNYLDLYKYGE